MSTLVEDLLLRNRAFVAGFDAGDLPSTPREELAVVTCMDARVDVVAALGLRLGDVHIIRNAGGVVTDDVIRSLIVSQRLLGTRELLVVGHTDCGMAKFSDAFLVDQIESETGRRPTFSFETFSDPDAGVRRSLQRIRHDPFLPHRDAVHGFVYDVATGVIR